MVHLKTPAPYSNVLYNKKKLNTLEKYIFPFLINEHTKFKNSLVVSSHIDLYEFIWNDKSYLCVKK